MEVAKFAGGILGIASAATIAGKGLQFIKDSALVAARVEEMNAVLDVLGKNAGYSAQEIDKQVASIKSMGIETSIAQTTLAQFIRYNLDMTQSAELARVAQDAAVISMQNSSDALDGLIYGITTFNPRVLRTYGIVVDSDIAFRNYAASIGKSADELSNAEKQQAYLNAVIESGTQISGAYDAAMGTAGKQMRSYERVLNDLQVTIGQDLQPALSEMITTLTDTTKWVNENYAAIKKWVDILSWFTSARISIEISKGIRSIGSAIDDVAMSSENFREVGPKAFGQMRISAEDLNPALVDTKDALEDGANVIGEYGREVRDAASDTRILEQAQLDAAASAEEMAGRNKDLIGLIDSMQSAEESYTSKSADLAAERDALLQKRADLIAAGWSVTSDKIKDVDQALADNADAADKNAKAHEDANRRIIFGYITQKLEMDGLTDDEINYLLELGVEWGIYSDTIIEEARQAMNGANAYLAGIQDRTVTITYVYEGGGFYEQYQKDDTYSGGKTTTQKTKMMASGGPVFEGNTYLVGENGPELLQMGNQRGNIIPNNQLGSSEPFDYDRMATMIRDAVLLVAR